MFKRSVLVTALSATSTLATYTKDYKLNTYWGQAGDSSYGLGQYCDSESIDYITLGFVNNSPENGNGTGYPGTNFAAHCAADVYVKDGRNSKLLSGCSFIKDDIKYCQSLGKKVLLSIGGVYSTSNNYSISSVQNGLEFADFLYNAFGPFKEGYDGPRPFDRSATDHTCLDGFDFDIEYTFDDQQPYISIVNHLRELIRGDQETMILSAAPQCPQADQYFQMKSILQQAQFDKLFIQFYNNPLCDATTDIGFNYNDWEDFVIGGINDAAELFIGLPGSPAATLLGNGYITPKRAKQIVCEYKTKNHFGGVMLWDAYYAGTNVDAVGRTYYDSVAEALRCGGCSGDVCPPKPTTSSAISSSTTVSSSSVSSSTSSTTSTASTFSSTTSTTTSSASTSTSATASSYVATSTSTIASSSATTSSSVTASSYAATSSSAIASSYVATSSSTTISSYAVTSSSAVTSSYDITSSSATASSYAVTSSSASLTGSSYIATSSSSAASSSTFTDSTTSSNIATSTSSNVGTTESQTASTISSTTSSDSSSATSSDSASAHSTLSSTSSLSSTVATSSSDHLTPSSTLSYLATITTTSSSSVEYTVSTVMTTRTYTVTSCAPTVTNCPGEGSIVTETIPLYTTVCPVTETQKKPADAPLTMSTIYSTKISTITACPPSVPNCPVGSITTETIAISTTVYPVAETETETQPAVVPTLYPVGGNNAFQVSPSKPANAATVSAATYPTASLSAFGSANSYVPATMAVAVYPTAKGGFNSTAAFPYSAGTGYPLTPTMTATAPGSDSSAVAAPTTSIVAAGSAKSVSLNLGAGLLVIVALAL
ncbi:Chitinase 2 [Parahypoxylon ruwenzoriense]